MSIKSFFERVTGHDPRVYDDRPKPEEPTEEVKPEPPAAIEPVAPQPKK